MKVKKLESIEIVKKERERERYFNKISFIYKAKNKDGL